MRRIRVLGRHAVDVRVRRRDRIAGILGLRAARRHRARALERSRAWQGNLRAAPIDASDNDDAEEVVRDTAADILRKIQGEHEAAVKAVAASGMSAVAFHVELPQRKIVERPTGQLAQLEALITGGGEGISHTQLWRARDGRLGVSVVN